MAKRPAPSKTTRTPAAKPAPSIGKLAELQAQIAELTRQAEEVRRAEIAEVVADIKQAIAQYGLTAADLGFSADGTLKKRGRRAAAGGAVKYTNGTDTWSGRGRRPQWFVAALEAGKTEADLLA